tara:strand:+ start:373 stop:738 length:366 start_codon:yes stop_codon:yes gene_type:complete
MFDLLFNELYKWIINHPEIYISLELPDFKKQFISFCNGKHQFKQNDNELLELKYYSDIVDIYLRMKNITQSFGSDLFFKKNDNANDLYCFLSNYVIFSEDCSDEEYEIESELLEYNEKYIE